MSVMSVDEIEVILSPILEEVFPDAVYSPFGNKFDADFDTFDVKVALKPLKAKSVSPKSISNCICIHISDEVNRYFLSDESEQENCLEKIKDKISREYSSMSEDDLKKNPFRIHIKTSDLE